MNEVIQGIDHASKQSPVWLALLFCVVLGGIGYFIVRRLFAQQDRNDARRDREFETMIQDNKSSRDLHHGTISKMAAEHNEVMRSVAAILKENSVVVSENTQEMRRCREREQMRQRGREH